MVRDERARGFCTIHEKRFVTADLEALNPELLR